MLGATLAAFLNHETSVMRRDDGQWLDSVTPELKIR